MTTKAQQLKKELTQTFPELKFSVKTEKRRQSWSDTPIIYFIRLTVTGLLGSSHAKSQIEKVASKYTNDATATYVTIKNIDGDSLYEEIMRMVPDYKNNWETVHKIADNDYFSVLPEGYYEKNQNSLSQDSAVAESYEEKAKYSKVDDYQRQTVIEFIETNLNKINKKYFEGNHGIFSVTDNGDYVTVKSNSMYYQYDIQGIFDALNNFSLEGFDSFDYYDIWDYLDFCKYTENQDNKQEHVELCSSIEKIEKIVSDLTDRIHEEYMDNWIKVNEYNKKLVRQLQEEYQELEREKEKIVSDLTARIYELERENEQLKGKQSEPTPEPKSETPAKKPTLKPKFKLPENFADYQQECDDLINALSCFYDIKKGKWNGNILQFILTPTESEKAKHPYPAKWKAGLYLQPGQWTVDKVSMSDPDDWEDWFMDINDFADANDIEIS